MSDIIDIVRGDRNSSDVIAQATSPRTPVVGEFISIAGKEYRVHRVEWIVQRETHNTASLGPIVYVREVRS